MKSKMADPIYNEDHFALCLNSVLYFHFWNIILQRVYVLQSNTFDFYDIEWNEQF